MTLHCWM